ncbi:hypothetical protein DNTS_033571 [Danionella cerebrum]|uniref:Mon2/Sec7/BIG1-like dimerisation and cyclophilin-binding domain-containing protein n=1 Tax=Danionella cerebrum TaxID=2873325 RepID=A0A553R459_9TELE|nr:hypothetical protein DNTS_033571 [Danionella translucida]
MEEILRRLQKEASGGKHKAIRDSCAVACGKTGEFPCPEEPDEPRFDLVFMFLGEQRMLCEVCFISEDAEEPEKQLLSQILQAVRVTPSLHEDLQVEVMKVLLCITYSSSFEMNGQNILRIAEMCIETYVSSCQQRSINTAVRATLSQILGDLTLQLRQRQENTVSNRKLRSRNAVDSDDGCTSFHQRKEDHCAVSGSLRVFCAFADASPSFDAQCEDVVMVLTVFCDKLESVSNENQLLQLLYLECILSMLNSSPPTMHQQRSFTDLIWKQLCPALVVIMGNPASDKSITSAHLGQSQDSDGAVSDQGRGSGCSSSAPSMIGPVVRTICYVAAELVRLVGCVESMKPVLQSLYHRILLYPPPQHRVEAIKIMKEVGMDLW